MNQSHLIGQETATVSSLPDGESFVPPGQDSRHPLRCLVPFPNFRPSHRSPEPSVPTAKRHSGVTFPQTPLWPFWHYFMLTHLVWSLFLQEFLSFWRAGVPSSLGPVSSVGDSAKSLCIASFSRMSDEQVNKEAVSGSP